MLPVHGTGAVAGVVAADVTEAGTEAEVAVAVAVEGREEEVDGALGLMSRSKLPKSPKRDFCPASRIELEVMEKGIKYVCVHVCVCVCVCVCVVSVCVCVCVCMCIYMCVCC